MDDGLPQRVCTNCVDRVRSCYEILDSFKAADSRLRQMVELCNLDPTNTVQNGSIALQADSSLPIILQTVNEIDGEGLVRTENSLLLHPSSNLVCFFSFFTSIPSFCHTFQDAISNPIPPVFTEQEGALHASVADSVK